MALQGDIHSFGISEIFQLISHQGKTGTLEIHTPDGLAKLRFLDGMLVEAWPDRRSPAELIGTLLVRSRLITSAQLQHALDVQRQSLRRLGDILIQLGALRISEFREILALQHRETVYSLLRLRRGRFRFVPEGVDVEEGVSTSMDLGGLLMEGFRQIDEWPKVTAKIPSEKTVYSRVTGTEVPDDLPSDEARMLRLTDGTATVREVVDRARMGEFPGWAALAGLLDRGLITPVGAARRPRPRIRAPRSRRGWDAVVALGLLGVAAAMFAFFSSLAVAPTERLEAGVRGARAEAARVAERAQRWRETVPEGWRSLPEP